MVKMVDMDCGFKVATATEKFGTETYTVWLSTQVKRVTNSHGVVFADVYAFRSASPIVGRYLGECVGHFMTPWQAWMDSEHAKAL